MRAFLFLPNPRKTAVALRRYQPLRVVKIKLVPQRIDVDAVDVGLIRCTPDRVDTCLVCFPVDVRNGIHSSNIPHFNVTDSKNVSAHSSVAVLLILVTFQVDREIRGGSVEMTTWDVFEQVPVHPHVLETIVC